MTLNLPLLYFVWTEEYCQTSPNKNKSANLWHVTSILVCCIFASNRLNRGLSSSPTLNYTSRNFEKESIFQNWAKIVVVHLLHIGTFTANRHLINSSFLFLSWKFSTRIIAGVRARITLKDIPFFSYAALQ